MENEKFINIRKTIQQTVLPLVQAIYTEEPSDLNEFCFQYFENRRKDTNETENRADGNIGEAVGLTSKDEEGHCIAETNDDCDTNPVSRSSIQGSASMPVLTSDKFPDCLPARETSSWNEPRKLSQKDGSRLTVECSLADVLSKIGDQASLVENSEIPEVDLERGDTSTTTKNDCDTEFKNQNAIEKNTVLRQDLEESNRSCMFPSTSRYEANDKTIVKVMPSTLANSQVTNKSLVEYSDERSSSSDDEVEAKNNIKSLKEVLRESMQISYSEPEKDDVNKCGGKLSPNSSFGFIPHLQEYRSRDEVATKIKGSEDNFFKSRSDAESENLTKNISKAFQGLAKEFSFAESNLNSELLKAKEISDVIHGSKRLESFGSSVITEHSNETNVVSESIKSTEESINEKKDSSDDLDKYSCNRNEVVCDANDSRCDKEMPHNFEEGNNSCKSECISYSNNLREDMKNEFQRNLPKSASGYKIINIKLENNKKENDLTKKDPISLKNTIEEENRAKNNETQSHVDESWRERWYEVHPRLDNTQTGFRQRFPTIHQAHRFDESNRISRSIQGIGEEGDVPRDPRFRAARGVPRGRMESYSESTLETNSSPDTFDECGNLCSSLSSDEIYKSMNSGRVACNFYNEGSIHRRAGVSSRNIPYSWRDMTTKQHSQLPENEEKIVNDSHLTPGYEVNSEIPSEVNYKVDLQVHDTTKDEFVEIEDPGYKYFEHMEYKRIESSEENGSDDDYEECVQSNENITKCNMKNNDFIAEDCDVQKENGVDVKYTDVGDAYVAYENLMFESQLEYFDNKPEHNENILSETNIYSQEFPQDQNEHSKGYETKAKFDKHDTESEEINKTNMAVEKISSETGDNKDTSLNFGSTVKVEPGLNSACGDFVATDNIENNQQEFNINPSSFTPGYLANLTQVEQSPTEAHTLGITQEDFEEVLRNVLNQQGAYPDDDNIVLLEGYQGSDSSNVESSDISEDDN